MVSQGLSSLAENLCRVGFLAILYDGCSDWFFINDLETELDLDMIESQVIMRCGSDDEKQYACIVELVRRRDNCSLCSLLFANTLVNSRNAIEINRLLTWYDRYPCTVETKGGVVPLCAIRIIVY